MKNKTRTKSINKKQVKAVKKGIPPSQKSLLSKKKGNKATGRNKSGLKDSATLRKRAAKPLNNENADKNQNFLKNIHDGCFELDLAGNFTFFNDSACRILGYSRKELMGMNYRRYTDKETAKTVFETYSKIYTTGEPSKGFNWQVIRKDGVKRYIETSVSLQKDSSGKITGFIGIVNDITERNDMRLYLKNIFDSMPSILIGIDTDGKVTQWNMEAEKVTKLSEQDAYGHRIEELLPQFSVYLNNIQETIKEKRPKKFEKVNYTFKGETRLYDIVAYPLIANGIQGAVIRVDDITSRVRFEEMMIQSEKMASVGGLAAGMAHEINNPISGIIMAGQNILRRVSNKINTNIQVAREVGTDIEVITKYMEKRQIISMIDGILEMADRASKIVSNMLNFSRKSKSEMVPEDLVDLVDKTIDLAAKDYDLKKQFDFRHIQIKKEYTPLLPKVTCMATEIQQVILNLLKNSAQAMSYKTYIHEKPTIKISIFQKHEMAIVEIEDNGPGMDEYVRKCIFEPFFTTKGVGIGTGLGLSVSYFIVTNNHGGTIEVKSQKDKGSTFIIKLPISH